MLGILGITLLGAGPLWLAAPAIAGFVAGDRNAADAIVIASLALGCDAMFNAGLHALRAELRSIAVLAWSTARSVALLVLSGVAVGVLGYGAIGALCALLAANVIGALALTVALVAGRGRFRWPLFRTLVGYGVPLCPGWFAESAAKAVERAVVVQRVGLAAAGLWYLALRLADVLSTLVHGPFAQVFIVRRYQLHRDGSPDAGSAALFSVFLAVMAWGAIVLSALAPQVVLLVSGRGFAAAASLVPAAAAVVVVFSLTTIVEMRLYLAKRPARITVAVVISALVHSALAYGAVVYWGVMGVAWARLVATCFRIVCLEVAARGLPGPAPEWRRLFGTTLVMVGCTLLCTILAQSEGLTSLAVRLGVALLFPLLILSSPLRPLLLDHRLLRRTP
jgi:O-antigen/teichoic acid export membrane protein